MNYQQFVVTTKENLALALGETMHLEIHTVLKNNGRERVGITISDQKINISPTLYLEEYYEQFKAGDPIDEIVDCILEVYREVRFEHAWNVESIKNFNIMREKIVYKIVHAQRNELLLQTLPHVRHLDLAIIFYVLFDVGDTGTATIPVTRELMALWNTDSEEIYRIACENTPQLLPPVFKPMQEVVKELMGDAYENISAEENLMYVLTNPLRSFGAACILYEGTLADIGKELGENYYVLPSSVHEIIMIPESNCPERSVLNDMVAEVNETQVDEEEMLSDHVYYYDCASETLRL